MRLDQLIELLPRSAEDLKRNYSSLILNNNELSTQQLWGTVVSSALATRSAPLTAAVFSCAPGQLSPPAFEAARTAASIMDMNNVFYRFQHLTSNPRYAAMPSRLRASGLRGHGVEDLDFELWCLAISAINGCGMCVDAHEKLVREKGATDELVLAVIRVASVIHAIGASLDASLAASELAEAWAIRDST